MQKPSFLIVHMHFYGNSVESQNNIDFFFEILQVETGTNFIYL